ncbi:VanZ family protein [Salipaludibacillus sp. LMS25]|uniref:VanZ family protein n=1 Tax=Salipaludibacillus sp. LMS25 TaxID=2924031 RepID=UPI0020D1D1A4|nr:VanZ family protein [Salipaludibacillus sp. LMS25]UTR13819.1 VanZ family protein [Salipaludibacillus sp. LMS25]
MLIDFNYTYRLIAAVVFIVLAIILKKKNKSVPYIIFFGFFYVYMMMVINYTQFPIITDLGAEYSLSNAINYTIANPFTEMNQAIILNVLLTIPFGFLVPFLLKVNIKKMVMQGLGLTLMIESLQLLVWIWLGAHLRYIDINDVICNLLGVMIGYGLFKAFCLFLILLVDRFKIEKDFFLQFVYRIADSYTNTSKEVNDKAG